MTLAISSVGSRLLAIRKAQNMTQFWLSSQCRLNGLPVSRQMLTHYERGRAKVPARFIPILAHVLGVAVTDLLPPIDAAIAPTHKVNGKTNTNGFGMPEAEDHNSSERRNYPEIKNLTGQNIRWLRKSRKITQHRLADVFQKMGIPITRSIIANIETQRCSVTDFQLVGFTRALQVPLQSFFERVKPCGILQVL